MTERGRVVRWIGPVFVATLLCFVPPGSSRAGEPQGRVLYGRYCASCHGATGQGDGPDAAIFSKRPRNLHEGFLERYGTEDLVRRVRDGRQLELALDPQELRTQAKQVEEVVGYLKRLPAIDWHLVEPGWETYIRRCELCHGPTGQPGATLPAGVHRPRDLSDPAVQRSISDKDLIVVVRHGRKGMPALTPRVPQSDGPALAAFVRLFSPGFTLYSRYCANCHGDQGRGVQNLGEAIRLPTVVFDRSYVAKHDPEELRKEIWHMLSEHKPAMPHYRWTISEAQARAIVEYLKSSEKKD